MPGSRLSPREPGPLDLLVIGDCNPDVMVVGGDVMPAFGQQEKLVDRISLEIGGSASITAVPAARLGLRVALAAAVGDDPAGRFMLGQLSAEGIDTAPVAVRADTPTGMTVALSAGGDRAILTATGAVATLTARDVPSGLLVRARHVHVSSYFLVEDSLGPGLATLLEAARAAAGDPRRHHRRRGLLQRRCHHGAAPRPRPARRGDPGVRGRRGLHPGAR